MAKTNNLKTTGRAALIAAAATAAATASTALFPTAAHAQTSLISNLTAARAGYTIFNSPTDWYAQEFTTSSATTSLLSATLVLNQQVTSALTDTVHLYIYSSTPALVNGLSTGQYMPSTTAVGDLGTATVSGTAATQYTFSSSGSISLSASQRYFLVATDNNSNVGWGYTTSTATTGSGATVDATSTTAASPDAGANWLVSNNTQGLQLFSLIVPSNTPEPGSLSLLLLGVGSGAIMLRRRKTQGAAKNALPHAMPRK